jgi:quinol-cytochrome oxidoreductase complex cytochrome b subunit
MASENSELVKGIASQLKLSAMWTFIAAVYFGLELGRHIWNVHDDFYPFTVLIWGGISAVWLLGFRGGLRRLTFAVPLADADATRKKTRRIFLVDIAFLCVSLCFGLCLVGSKQVGGLYIVAAVVFGVLLVLIGFIMYRAIKRLAEFVKPLGSV